MVDNPLLTPEGNNLLTPGGFIFTTTNNSTVDSNGQIIDPIPTNLQWISPNAGQLTTLIELQSGNPVFQTEFQVTNTYSVPGQPSNFTNVNVYYKHVAGDLPEYSRIVQKGLTADFIIGPLVRELDDYIEEFERPPNFSYDGPNKSGENYASYGSAKFGNYTCTFTIRAYDANNLTSFVDSNGEIQYDETGLENVGSTDRTFSVFITNNWSSDRDKFMLEYFKDIGIEYDSTKYSNIEEFLIKIKQDGYYL